jgi:hypothetical protein
MSIYKVGGIVIATFAMAYAYSSSVSRSCLKAILLPILEVGAACRYFFQSHEVFSLTKLPYIAMAMYALPCDIPDLASFLASMSYEVCDRVHDAISSLAVAKHTKDVFTTIIEDRTKQTATSRS